MKDLRNLKVDELKDIARTFGMVGAWKMTKDRLIEGILKNDRGNNTNEYYDSAEGQEAPQDVQNAPESTEEETEVTNQAPEENATEDAQDTPKEVKKPSLKIKELTYNGKTQTIKEWAAELEMPWPTLYDRINRNGWSVEEALTIPLGARRPKN